MQNDFIKQWNNTTIAKFFQTLTDENINEYDAEIGDALNQLYQTGGGVITLSKYTNSNAIIQYVINFFPFADNPQGYNNAITIKTKTVHSQRNNTTLLFYGSIHNNNNNNNNKGV